MKYYYSFFLFIGYINLWLLITHKIPCQKELFYLVFFAGTFIPLFLKTLENYKNKNFLGIVLDGLTLIFFILVMLYEIKELGDCADILFCKYRNEGSIL